MKIKTPGLSALFMNFSLLMFFGAVIVMAFPFRDYFVELEEEVQSEVASSAGRSLQLATSRAVEREWQSLLAAAQLIDISDVEATRSLADAIVDSSDAIGWVGIANRTGRVVAGSSGLREGEDVSMRRWYREGSISSSVGNVYTPSASNVPNAASGLINISTPIIDQFGVARGVVVYSLRIEWLLSYLDEAAGVLDVDYQLRDDRGIIVAEQTNRVGLPMPNNIESLIRLRQEFVRVSYSAHNTISILAIYPDVMVGDVPSFNWTLVVRVPAVASIGDVPGFVSVFRNSLAALFVLTFAGCAIFAALVLHPIERLARDARTISDGGDIYPLESHTSRESSRLSYALGAMQPRLHTGSRRPK
ncbi:hypothetical protein HKCCE3408_19030 [Rhodobacterales bacterium HKCCE3408]|nr:hypothetical protein [Rhodobacterales bacterium HKCCE3408]